MPDAPLSKTTRRYPASQHRRRSHKGGQRYCLGSGRSAISAARSSCVNEPPGSADEPLAAGKRTPLIGPFYRRLVAVENVIHSALVSHGITALRLTVGAVFLGFGVLKYFPHVSPAEGLAIKTIDLMTFGLVPWQVGIVVIATLECFIGICLLANRWMRLAVWMLAVQLVGVLAPLALLTGRLFSGPHHAPTLEGQYVLKDIILVAAGMVIAAGTFRGGRLVRDEPQPERGTVGAALDEPAPAA